MSLTNTFCFFTTFISSLLRRRFLKLFFILFTKNHAVIYDIIHKQITVSAFTTSKTILALTAPVIPPMNPHADITGNAFFASFVGNISLARVQNVKNNMVFDKYDTGYSAESTY